jgi:hypothetical protein
MNHRVKPGEYFYARVGFLNVPPPKVGKVRFSFGLRPTGLHGVYVNEMPESLVYMDETSDGQIVTILQKLPPHYEIARAFLRVESLGETYQDWACWVEAKIVR